MQNILNLTGSDLNDMPSETYQVLKFESSDTADVDSAESLKQRIMEYIHLKSIEGIPVRLASLNRHFVRAATKYKTSVRVLVGELIKARAVIQYDRHGRIGMFSRAVHDHNREIGMLDSSIGDIELNALKNLE